MLKRTVAAVLVLGMLVCTLGGCAAEPKKEEAAAAPAAQEAAKPASDEPVTISVMWLNQSPEVTKWAEYVVAEFEKENPNVKVEMNTVAQEDYFAKLQTQVAAGDAADITWQWNSEIGAMIDAGKIYDLADYIDMDKFLPTFRMASLVEYYKEPWGGHVWGVPFSFSNYMYIYNPQLFKKAGVEPTTDFHKWLDNAKAIKDKTDAYFIGIPTTAGDYTFNGYFFLIGLTNYGGGFTDGKGGAAINTALNVDFMQALADLYHGGYISPDTGWSDYQTLFSLEKCASTIDGSYTFGTYTGYNPEFTQDMYGVVPAEGDNYAAVGCGMNFLTITKFCDHPEVAAKLIEKFTDTRWSSLEDYVSLGMLSEMEAIKDEQDPAKIQENLFKVAPFQKSFSEAAWQLKPVQPSDITAGQYAELENIVGKYMEEIFYNNMDVKAAMDEAQKEAEAVLAQ